MAKIERKNLKIFGDSALNTDIEQFGSLANGAPVKTTDPETIQSLSRYDSGWRQAVRSGTQGQQVPNLWDLNALFYINSYHTAYQYQEGIPEWDDGTTYYQNSICKLGSSIYLSRTDDNLNNDPATDTTNWAFQYTLQNSKVNFDRISLDYGQSGGDVTSNIEFNRSNTTNFPAASIGFDVNSINSGIAQGDILFSTRNSITDVAPTERMRITDNGNIGIGVSDPDDILDIRRDIDDNLRCVIRNENDGTGNVVSYLATSYNNQLNLESYGSNHSTRAGQNWISSRPSGTTLILATSNLARAAINSLGNFGIGTTSPDYKLQISSSGITGGQTLLNIHSEDSGSGEGGGLSFSSLSRGEFARIYGLSGTGSDDGDLVFETSDERRMTINRNGDVGIGITPSLTSPTIRFEVHTSSGDARSDFSVSGTEYSSTLDISSGPLALKLITYGSTHSTNASESWLTTETDDGPLVFGIEEDEAFRLNTNNQVIFSSQIIHEGTESTLADFGTDHGMRAGLVRISKNQNSDTGLLIYNNDDTSGASSSLSVNNRDSSIILRSYSSTNGTFANQRHIVYSDFLSIREANNVRSLEMNSSGNLFAYHLSSGSTGATLRLNASNEIIRDSSSKRYKEKIKPIKIDTSKIYDFKAVSFDWKKSKEKDFGFVAEDVYKLIPELVFKRKSVDEEGKEVELVEGINYDRITVMLVSELQKLKKEVDDLKGVKDGDDKETKDNNKDEGVVVVEEDTAQEDNINQENTNDNGATEENEDSSKAEKEGDSNLDQEQTQE